jgi:hypothetical protein
LVFSDVGIVQQIYWKCLTFMLIWISLIKISNLIHITSTSNIDPIARWSRRIWKDDSNTTSNEVISEKGFRDRGYKGDVSRKSNIQHYHSEVRDWYLTKVTKSNYTHIRLSILLSNRRINQRIKLIIENEIGATIHTTRGK